MEKNNEISKGFKGLKDLLVGVRNDNDRILSALSLVAEKVASKDNIKLNVVAEQEGVREVKITNQPDVQKVEITNLEKAPEVSKVEVLNQVEIPDSTKLNNADEIYSPVVKEIKTVTEELKSLPSFITKLIDGIKNIPSNIFSVKVTNQVDPVRAVKILNESVNEAIPVKLVDRKGKNFYDAVAQAFAGSEVNMQRTNEKLDTLAGYLKGLDGSPTNGQVVLTNANTWYQVPQSGSVPTVDYTLIISKETAVGTVRFGFNNNSTPSTTNGNQFSNNDFIVQLAANEVMYFGSSSALDSVNWTIKGSI